MKNLYKIILILILGFTVFSTLNVNAWIDTSSIKDSTENITKYSTENIESTWVISQDIKTLWFKVLTLIKYIISWWLVLVIVYVGIQMIMSMWSNEEDLSAAKKQLRYTLIALIFINIPWSLYSIINKEWWNTSIDWSLNNTWSTTTNESVLVNIYVLDTILWSWILIFVEVVITSIAVLMIMIAGIKIMTSRWRDEQITENKNKITWSLIWLMFIWFIEALKSVVYSGRILNWAKMFKTMEELALYFAWPIAIAFLTLAWYYFITANGDEEKIKKAKNIIINTLIATVIILASHAFLKDLITL